ncbi:DUF3833 domain-containing protein [Psychromonas sp. psych-6C06]|uniref:DUF3833 domain-containing protein n=1 Tax=Psychromonas sp. psych-6C06 TaxID=2058089 RepID=UPI000C342D65|nr:DUF3833 domain-containing protein [Psychromonas sp. psych-6C06]PKF63345.1 DUF3833 domain-containing protein [Psychromonas sp. psych-6C06]
MKSLLIIFSSLMLVACSSQKLSDYDQTTPVFDVKTFFNGPLQAKGIVLDRSGKVTRRFSVEMIGTWEDNQGTLAEWFVFDDGEKTERTWVINKLQDGRYTGTAGDIVGEAQGQSAGFALQWDYELDLTVDDSVYRVTFDDWLYQIDEQVVINRSYIKKWGINVGEVILVITK